MNSRILLVSNNKCSTPYTVFPLGVAQIAAVLLQKSFIVKIYDVNDSTLNLENTIKTFEPQYIGISQRNIDDLNIKGAVFFAETICGLVKSIRRISSAKIVIGGSGFSLFPKEIFERCGADFGIVGEGDMAFPELLSALEDNNKYEMIPGLVYRCNGKVQINKRKTCLPCDIVPAFRPGDLCNLYIKNSLMLNIQTQRGCPYKCCYCTYPVIEGRKMRRRDYREVCDELAAMSRLGCRYFFIVDSVFNSSNAYVTDFCEELIKRDLNMSWACFLRPRGLSGKLMKLMARAGLSHIEFGSDSLSDAVLDSYGKAFTFDDILRSSNNALNAGIHYAHFLIAGGPGETEDTLLDAYNNSRQLKKTVFFPYVGMRIYPQTALCETAIEEKIIDSDADLFEPKFYVSPKISEEKIFSLLGGFNSKSPNWIVEELPESLKKVVQSLRSKGIAGPLWEFLAR